MFAPCLPSRQAKWIGAKVEPCKFRSQKNMPSYHALRKEPKVLLICCSQLSYEEWAKHDLRLEPMDVQLISIPGGPAALAHRHRVPEKYSELKKDIKLMLKKFPSIHTVIAVNHEDCGYYEEVLKFKGREEIDLGSIARKLAIMASGKNIETFFAKPIKPGSEKLEFQQIVF